MEDELAVVYISRVRAKRSRPYRHGRARCDWMGRRRWVVGARPGVGFVRTVGEMG